MRQLLSYLMTSIYRRALQSDFERLHPMIQERFGLDSENGVAAIDTGVMEEVWRGRFYTVPFLYFGTLRNIMFPETGEDVPFTVENYAYVDCFDRETVTWARTFEMDSQPRRFDATMVYSEQRDRIVDYLGTHQHLAVDIITDRYLDVDRIAFHFSLIFPFNRILLVPAIVFLKNQYIDLSVGTVA